MPKLKRAPLTPNERSLIREQTFAELEAGKIHLGQALRRFRLKFTGLNQKQFGRLTGFSATTISAIERDPESGTVRTINKILRKFGMQLTMGMINRGSEAQPESVSSAGKKRRFLSPEEAKEAIDRVVSGT